MLRRYLIFALLPAMAALLLTACDPFGNAGLLSVSADAGMVTLHENESVRIPFSVDEPGFKFDLEKDVVLYLAESIMPYPHEFQISGVEQGDGAGDYIATISDLGISRIYSEKVMIGVRAKEGNFVFSEKFTCRGDLAGTHGVSIDTGLPTLYLDTEGSMPISSKTNFVVGSMIVRGTDGSVSPEPMECQVRGRGNTTWTWPKKPYLVKFEKKQSLFGMPAHKRWVLLANFMDRTMMRNIVAMKVSSMTRLDWTPRCQSVELVLNGRHMGNYLLIEQVRVDKDRVPAGDDGWLLESDFHYDNEVQWIDPHGQCVQRRDGIPFGVKYPDSDEITPAQKVAIKQYVSDVAVSVYGSNFRDSETGYAKYIDVDSFIDYWLVFEVMGNHELGNPGSVFYHKTATGKLIAGPCWDFDWGVLSFRYNPQAQYGLLNLNACWYSRLFQDPAFRAKAKARFEELLPQLQTIPSYIDAVERQLKASAELNFAMWNPAQDASQNGGQIINGDENLDFHAAVVRLKANYQTRLNVIKANL